MILKPYLIKEYVCNPDSKTSQILSMKLKNLREIRILKKIHFKTRNVIVAKLENPS